MKQSVTELQNSLTSVKVDVERTSQQAELYVKSQLSDLQSEIATVKGLLLSR